MVSHGREQPASVEIWIKSSACPDRATPLLIHLVAGAHSNQRQSLLGSWPDRASEAINALLPLPGGQELLDYQSAKGQGVMLGGAVGKQKCRGEGV